MVAPGVLANNMCLKQQVVHCNMRTYKGRALLKQIILCTVTITAIISLLVPLYNGDTQERNMGEKYVFEATSSSIQHENIKRQRIADTDHIMYSHNFMYSHNTITVIIINSKAASNVGSPLQCVW